VFPTGANAVKASIPSFPWTEAVVIKPHHHTAQVQSREPKVANWEEL
jgi:hypothetical protein